MEILGEGYNIDTRDQSEHSPNILAYENSFNAHLLTPLPESPF